MKMSPMRVIPLINVLLLVGASLYGASGAAGSGYGSPAALMNFALAIWLIPLNAVLGCICGIIYLVGAKRVSFSASWSAAFLVSTGGIILLNTPACLMLNLV